MCRRVENSTLLRYFLVQLKLSSLYHHISNSNKLALSLDLSWLLPHMKLCHSLKTSEIHQQSRDWNMKLIDNLPITFFEFWCMSSQTDKDSISTVVGLSPSTSQEQLKWLIPWLKLIRHFWKIPEFVWSIWWSNVFSFTIVK